MSSMAARAADPDDFARDSDDVRARIDLRLDRLLAEDPFGRDLVRQAMREAALAPARRLRPLIVVHAARDLGSPSPAALDAGAALELLHVAALLVDDLPFMAGTVPSSRHERLALRLAPDVAVPAAMGLTAQAVGLAAAIPLIGERQRLDLVTLIADVAGVHGLTGGRLAGQAGLKPSSTDILIAREHRTGSLFLAAFAAAGIVADAPPDRRRALRLFAKELGRAFEILDELVSLGAEPDPEDVATGRAPTLIAALGPEAARRRLRGHVAKALDALHAGGAPMPRIAALSRMIFSDAVADRRRRAEELAGRGPLAVSPAVASGAV